MLIGGQPAEHDCGGWLDRPARVGADYQTVNHEFGVTADAVTAAARDSIHGTPATSCPEREGSAGRPT
jgi:hypothetical protein